MGFGFWVLVFVSRGLGPGSLVRPLELMGLGFGVLGFQGQGFGFWILVSLSRVVRVQVNLWFGVWGFLSS